MKHISKFLIIAILCFALCACNSTHPTQIAATTAPVRQFASALCEGTDLTVCQVVTESVSCLHDYTLTVGQMQMVESAELVIISGAGLEEFMEDVLEDRNMLDASQNIPLLEMDGSHHEEHEAHHHEHDPHIWLSPANARIMAENICRGLSAQYPEHTDTFERNLENLVIRLQELQTYGEAALTELACRELITFHNGFGYLADAFDLEILEAIEEESGSEASAQELIGLIEEVEHRNLPAVFTEINGSASAAGVICAETGTASYSLDMAMSGEDYFESMYHNIDTLKEALQ